MIEKASQSNLEEIKVKSVDSLYEGTANTFKPSQERAGQIFRAVLEQGGYYLVLKEDGDLKGWVLIGTNKDYFSQENVGFIYELYVLPNYRGKGRSKFLMKMAIEELVNKWHEEIRLNVHAENFAKEIYKGFGFVERQVTMSLRL